MGRPLLTDEIIERANRGELVERTMAGLDEATKVIFTGGKSLLQAIEDDDTIQIDVAPSVIKSRRIEHQKRGAMQSKLNKVLAGLVLLLILLIVAILKF